MKTCTKCLQAKPLAEFYRQTGTPDGHRYYCKACTNAINKAGDARRRREFNGEFSETQQRRFWSQVVKGDRCWEWQGLKFGNGYGMFSAWGQGFLAHRVAYTLAIGPIPAGMTIDHVRVKGCTSRACVNPDHLEAVTMRENLLRGDSMAGRNARKERCKNGHDFTPENTYVTPEGWRRCRKCRDYALARHYARKTD